MKSINLLDCTLRDGGYLNDWKFGRNNIIDIFERLVSARIDIIEVGFIDERRKYDPDRTIFPNALSVNTTYDKLHKGKSMIVGMIDYGTCNIDKIIPCRDSFMDGIRVIFKESHMYEAIEFCRKIKKLGYLVFVQAVSITSYTDEKLKELIDIVNKLEPYAFSLVDTYGLLHKSGLMHYYNAANKYLKKTIGIGYHSHNNFQLAYANCIELLEDAPQERMLLVDGSLYGMGKSAGNAPTELLAMFMMENFNKEYENSQLLEAIDVTILDLFRQIPWGYNFKFFIAASHDCHPSYVSYLMDKKKLSVKSIHEILLKIEKNYKLNYNGDYIEQLYISYQKSNDQDLENFSSLEPIMYHKEILLLGPGNTIETEKDKIKDYIKKNAPVIISVNFLPDNFKIDYLFISNAKRYVQMSSKACEENKNIKMLATSNVTKAFGKFDYVLQYDKLLDEMAMIIDNPMIMILKFLSDIGVKRVALAGFDGYTVSGTSDYFNPNMEYSFSKQKAELINQDVVDSVKRIKNLVETIFITTTKYLI
ncbi:MAG: aldolase catalytic domain-containing protein [Lachnospiraceae bacterium]|nr:aldolase catalytic domain-containing protein [Lachnospiraceae bacterium]